MRANKKEQLEFSAHQMLLATTTVKLYRPSCFRFVQHHTAPQASARKCARPSKAIRMVKSEKQVEVHFPKSKPVLFLRVLLCHSSRQQVSLKHICKWGHTPTQVNTVCRVINRISFIPPLEKFCLKNDANKHIYIIYIYISKRLQQLPQYWTTYPNNSYYPNTTPTSMGLLLVASHGFPVRNSPSTPK